MMKPEFSKPFDIEHAKAGAPFCGSNGEAVRVLIWDRKHPKYPILAIEEDGEQEAVAFAADGSTGHCYGYLTEQLVMLPLGLIDGKPVFVGDELEVATAERAKVRRQVTTSWVGNWEPEGWRWPTPEREYPQTTMLHGDMFEVYSKAMRELGYTHVATESSAIAAVANAALRHAIDAEQVVTADDHAAALHRLGEKLRGITLGGRAARDMAVAIAVRAACRDAVGPPSLGAIERVGSIDLAAIIATIK